MPTIHVIRGLPASGKTTLAKTFITPGTMYINRDTLRTIVGYESPACFEDPKERNYHEALVTRIEKDLFKTASDSDLNIVYDNVNGQETLWMVKQYCSRYNILNHCVIASVDTCVARQTNRERKVPSDVIQSFADRYEILINAELCTKKGWLTYEH